MKKHEKEPKLPDSKYLISFEVIGIRVDTFRHSNERTRPCKERHCELGKVFIHLENSGA